MKQSLLILSIASLVLVAGCAVRAAPRGVVVRPVRVGAPPPARRVVRPVPVRRVAVAPPPARPAVVVARPARPGRAYVWRDGHYAWRSGRYSWVAGAWIVPPRGKTVWVPGVWRRNAWVAGYWT